MNHKEVGRYWNQNADNWTKLARAGYDFYRDCLNTPAFLDMLPDVQGLVGLDIGCGDGDNTRQLASRGAKISAIDISERFIHHARETEQDKPLGIDYQIASAVELPFEDCTFDFATAFMSMMDIPENDKAIAEAARVLKPGGFLQFSITHPCTDTPHRKNLRDANGKSYSLELGGYFNPPQGRVDHWLFGSLPDEVKANIEPFATPRFYRTLSGWLNTVVAVGLTIERIEEPTANDEAVARYANIQDTQIMPYFLHVRGRKPA